ncbi:hypothetical protein N7470_006796 [Penicillium chermesinum]|nr:hypothetical protein N7470_006796 [Penicillium chermesinum]
MAHAKLSYHGIQPLVKQNISVTDIQDAESMEERRRREDIKTPQKQPNAQTPLHPNVMNDQSTYRDA